jgi:hypothetical protein
LLFATEDEVSLVVLANFTPNDITTHQTVLSIIGVVRNPISA